MSDTKRDVAENRGYDWKVRSAEVKESDEWTCQRCGRDKYGEYVPMDTHHIVPGNRLSIADARIDLNLVTVCCRCHHRIEKYSIKTQFREVGREDVATILKMLEGGRCTPAYIADEIDRSQEYVRDCLRQLKRLGLVNDVYRGLYELAECEE